jgi:UDP:flavonoid glycosyltransferase YjiC (YdhE family)
MRVLFAASEWAGHYFCMVPMAWALQAAGHEVRVTCKPSHAGSLARAGLTAVPVADGPDLTVLARVVRYVEISMGRREAHGPLRNPFTGEPLGGPDELDVAVEGPKFWAEAAAATRRGCDAVAEFAREWRPELVLHDVMAPEGALAAGIAGVPSVFCAPGLFGTVEDEPGLDLRPADPVEHFERHGVGPWGRDRIEYVIDPSPDGAVPPLGDALRLPVRFTPYNGPAVAPGEAPPPARGRRVCILWGNSAVQIHGPDVPGLRHAIEAAAERADEVVLTTVPAQVEALGALPPNVRVLRNFPLHLLLEQCDLLVHHGSDNPMMNAAAAGVPQVALALADDHFAFGRRLDPLGASRTVPGFTAGRDEVAAAVEAGLTDPSMRDAAIRLRAGMMARPSSAELVPALERLAATGSLSAADLPDARRGCCGGGACGCGSGTQPVMGLM